MKGKPMFITGRIVDFGIDGEGFAPDSCRTRTNPPDRPRWPVYSISSVYLYDRVKTAWEGGLYKDSQVFRLVPVKIRKATIKKWGKG